MKNKALSILLLCGLLTTGTLPAEALIVLHEDQNMAVYSIVDDNEMDNIQCGRANEIDLEAIKANKAELRGYLNADKSNPTVGTVENITQLPNGNHLLNISVRNFSEDDDIDVENPPADLFALSVLMELRLAPVWNIDKVTLDEEKENYSYNKRIWGCPGWEKREIKDENTGSSIGMPTMREQPQADTRVFTGELGVNITPYIEASLGRRLNSAIILTSSFSGYKALNEKSMYRNLQDKVPPVKNKRAEEDYSQNYRISWKGSEKDGTLDLKTEMELEKIKENSGKLDAWNHDDPWNHGPYKDLPMQVTQEDGNISIQVDGLAESLGLGKDFFEKRKPNTIEDARNLMDHVKATPPIFGEPVVATAWVGKAIKPSATSGESSRKEVKASEEEGEQDIDIPASAVALASGIAAGGATLAWKRRKKGKASEAAANEEKVEQEKEEEKGESTYRMRVYKDYGNVLYPGQEVNIFAKMVEITPDGKELDAPDLTRLIGIHADNYLEVYGQTMSGQYKSACVKAPEKEQLPAEARVIFSFACYTVVMRFDVVLESIDFYQENLTIPAGFEDDLCLPFTVSGIAEDDLVEAVIDEGKEYYVRVETGEKPGLYYAVIHELLKTKDEPGNYESYRLVITAHHGKRSFREEFPIYRFHMGLVVELDNFNCYPNKERQRLGQLYPEDTNGCAVIYDWDPATNEILTIAPALSSFKLNVVDVENYSLLEALGINWIIKPEPVNGRLQFTFLCGKGLLDSPTRFKLKVSITAKYKDKTYTWEEERLARSQPLRTNTGDVAESLQLIRDERHTTDYLKHIIDYTMEHGDLDRFMPLVSTAQILVDGYDPAYGYDEKMVAAVKRVFLKCVVNNGVNQVVAEPIDEEHLFTDTLISYMEDGRSLEDSLDFFWRVGLGVFTVGVSELYFSTCNTIEDIKAYVFRGGNSIYGGFCVGVKAGVIEFGVDYAIGLGIAKLFKYAKAPLKRGINKGLAYVEKLAKKNKLLNFGVEKVKEFTNTKVGKKMKGYIKKNIDLEDGADKEAQEYIKKNKKDIKYSDKDIKMDKLFHEAGVEATAKINNFDKAYQRFLKNPTAKNERLCRDAMLKVQEDKFSVRRLNERPYNDKLRKGFNDTINKIYQSTDKKVKEELAKRLNKMHGTRFTADDIELFNATGSKRTDLAMGKKVTYDRDMTWQVKGHKEIKIDQKMASDVYNEKFFEESVGCKPLNQAEANSFALAKDQATMNSEDCIGHYGYKEDLNAFTKDFATKLRNPEKVSRAVVEKSQEWFEQAHKSLAKAVQAEATNPAVAAQLFKESQRHMVEGIRQMFKQYKYVNARDLAAVSNGATSQISKKFRVNIKLCSKLLESGPSQISLKTCEKLLEKRGTDIYKLVEEMGEIVRNIG